VVFGVVVPMRGFAEPPAHAGAMWVPMTGVMPPQPADAQNDAQPDVAVESLDSLETLLPADFTSLRLRCMYPRQGYIATQLADLEFEMSALGLSRNLVILDSEILPIFLLFQSTRARYLNYWFVENTEEMRVVFHPLRGQMETYRGVAELVRPHMPRWRVMAMTLTTVPPPAPRGAFYQPLVTFELAGRRLFMWALLPVGT
jgi:hypothetical protein